jgi:small subunit ribosomal protein S16
MGNGLNILKLTTMPVKIRLQRKGRKKQPFYHIVVADARAPRDGRFIEQIGIYNPMTKPATITLDIDKAYQWLRNGAQPTETTKAIFRYKGVYFKKHLMRGVMKGALTEEQANEQLAAWLAEKETKIQEQVNKTQQERLAFLAMVDGVAAPPKPKKTESSPLLEAASEPEGEQSAE